MSSQTTIAERHLAVWNEPDAERRRALIQQTWAEDASYIDPLAQGAGHSGIDTMIAAFQAQFPGYRFRPAGAIESHHSYARFSWEMAADGQAPIAGGTDFAVLAADGRLQSVVGFLDFVPAMASE